MSSHRRRQSRGEEYRRNKRNPQLEWASCESAQDTERISTQETLYPVEENGNPYSTTDHSNREIPIAQAPHSGRTTPVPKKKRCEIHGTIYDANSVCPDCTRRNASNTNDAELFDPPISPALSAASYHQSYSEGSSYLDDGTWAEEESSLGSGSGHPASHGYILRGVSDTSSMSQQTSNSSWSEDEYGGEPNGGYYSQPESVQNTQATDYKLYQNQDTIQPTSGQYVFTQPYYTEEDGLSYDQDGCQQYMNNSHYMGAPYADENWQQGT